MTATVLMLCADAPDPHGIGGVQVHTAALALNALAGMRTYTAHPDGNELVVEGWQPNRRRIAYLPIEPIRGHGLEPNEAMTAAIVSALAGLEAEVLHVHSVAAGPDVIRAAIERSGTKSALTLHDHALVCINYELLEAGRRYCEVPADFERCGRCLSRTRSLTARHLERWRAAGTRLIDTVDAVVAPSESVLEHAHRAHPHVRARARVIPWGVPRGTDARPRSWDRGPLRVAIVGVFAHGKGAERLPELLAACRGTDVEWHLFGATEGRSLRRVRRAASRVVAHGSYRRAELGKSLLRSGCHLAVLPSIVPESFSLTLSEVLATGLPALVSNIGALAERVGAAGLGWTFDPWNPQELADRIAELDRNRQSIADASSRVASHPKSDELDMARAHAELWGELASRQPESLPDTERLKEALSRFADGSARARSERPSRFASFAQRVRRTHWYRDLALRRVVSEDARRAAQRALFRLGKRVRWR